MAHYWQKIENFTILTIFDFSTKSCGLENSFLKTRILRIFIPKSMPLDRSKWIFEQLRKVNKINTSRVFYNTFSTAFPTPSKTLWKTCWQPTFFEKKVGKKAFNQLRGSRNNVLLYFTDTSRTVCNEIDKKLLWSFARFLKKAWHLLFWKKSRQKTFIETSSFSQYCFAKF